MNGVMLAELRDIIRGNQKISSAVANRLIITGLIQLADYIQPQIEDQNEKITKIVKVLDELPKQFVTSSSCAIKHEMIEAQVILVKGNLAVRVGNYIARKPKYALIIGISILTIASIWFSSGMMYMVLIWLGVPPGLVDTLKFIGSITPHP